MTMVVREGLLARREREGGAGVEKTMPLDPLHSVLCYVEILQ